MDDFISRQAAIDATWEEPTYTDPMNVLTEVRDRIEALPSAQPERKTGKWIPHEDEDGEHYGDKCSECGEWYVMPYGKTNFCPHCGAKMEGVFRMNQTKAEWRQYYDWRSDKIYSRPCCPDCEEPIIYSGNQYVCMLCEAPVQVDDKMKEYISEISEVKIKWNECFKCGNKNCVETYYHRNPATMEWETMHGKCTECGTRFIV